MIQLGAVGAGSLALPLPGLRPQASAQPGWFESHGLSTFGELDLREDFRAFRYVNPNAPKGGRLVQDVTSTSAINGTFETFDSFNTFVLRGAGATGLDAIYDTLMSGSGDEPTSLYGLVARRVRWSPDKLVYQFTLRPEARFHDGTRLTAHDAAFTFNTLKAKGHPSYKLILREFEKAEAESDEVLTVRFTARRSRDVHLTVAGLPILPQAFWKNRDFEAPTLDIPLGSGPYRLSRFEQGRYVEFARVPDYWGRDLPVSIGQNNFDIVRYEYFRDRQIAFEAFKSGALNYREEYTARIWHTAYKFPALEQGRVKKEELPQGRAVAIQGWYFNLRRRQFQDARVREAIAILFDYEWTNRNIMYSTYKRTASFFQNTDMQAKGPPSPEEMKLLEPWRGKVPNAAFEPPWEPPVSDGSGADRQLLRRADDLLREAGCKRNGRVLLLPDGKPLQIEFLENDTVFTPHTQPFQANLRRLGINTSIRVVDAAQYKRRVDNFDYDMLVSARGGSTTPGDGLRNFYSSQAAKMNGSRNFIGLADPAVDDMVERIANAQSREELTTAARVLDRLLRAGRYWIPMWYNDVSRVAYWDVFSRPNDAPRFSSGAPGTWWWDEEKARRIGLTAKDMNPAPAPSRQER
jgi:microcin C transport system substrate-binding protein